MTKYLYTIILIASFSFYGCNMSNKKECINDLFSNSISIALKHEKVEFNNHIWGIPMDMIYCDSTIMIFDEKMENGLFHLVDINHSDSVFNFGAKGQGQDEYLMPFDFQFIGNNSFTVFDLYKKTLSRLKLSDLQNNTKALTLVKDTITGTTKVLPTAFGTYLSLGFYEDCMFKLWGGALTEIKKYAEYPYKDENEHKIDNNLRGMAYQGFLRIHPNLDKFVYATTSSDIIYFYQIDSINISLIKKYEMSYPTYIPQSDGDTKSAAISSLNNNSFLSLCISPEYIYCLYSGKNFKDNGLTSFSGNLIYVFDWDGNAVKKYELDIPVTQICVDDKNDRLYAFANIPNPELIKFELNN